MAVLICVLICVLIRLLCEHDAAIRADLQKHAAPFSQYILHMPAECFRHIFGDERLYGPGKAAAVHAADASSAKHLFRCHQSDRNCLLIRKTRAVNILQIHEG